VNLLALPLLLMLQAPTAEPGAATLTTAPAAAAVETVAPPIGDVATTTGVPPNFDRNTSLWAPFAKTMLMLCLVLAIAYLALGKGLGKLMEKAQQGKRVRVIERVALDARHSLYLVDIDGQRVVLGGGNGTVNLLKELAPEPTPATPQKNFLSMLRPSPSPTIASTTGTSSTSITQQGEKA
jgi:flagellar biogenesis protein FliO